MKNFKRILAVIIVIFCLGLIIEAGSYLWQSKRLVDQGYRFANNAKKPPYPTTMISFSENYFKHLDKERIVQNITGENHKSPSILLFGDVYANSYDNSDNTFAHQLSKAAKRPVINLGESGWGISQMYFLLQNEKDLEKFNPETIIFFYHNDMKNRLTSFSFYPHHSYLNLKYKLKNGKLTEDKPVSISVYRSYAVRNIERFLGWRKAASKNAKIQQKNFDLIQTIFEESKKLAQEKYPNLKKFIILRQPADWETLEKLEQYKTDNKIAEIEYNMWQKLKKEGFIVIDITELTDININKQENHSKDSSLKPAVTETFMPAFIKETELIINQPAKKKKTAVIKKKSSVIKKKPAVYKNKEIEQKSGQIIKKEPLEEEQNIKNCDNNTDKTVQEKKEGKFKRFISKFKRNKDGNVDK